MRVRALLLLLICIVGSSIIFIAFFSNPRPSIQTLVTETHKQLKNFQDNLKDVEEKRFVTDSKYLAILGLDKPANMSFTPSNSSNVTVVSLLRPGNEHHIYGFVKNVTHFLPNNNIAIYSLGLSDDNLLTVKTVCNSSKCAVIPFDLRAFPAHAEDDRLHVYRPLVIQAALSTLGNIVYMDSNVRLNSSDVFKYFLPKSGVLTWPTKHAISTLTHPKMYEYFHMTTENSFFLPLVTTSYLIIRNTKDIRDHVMTPWVQCALTRDCICPIGAQSAGCRFNKKPQYRYSGCHAYDTSALNIVLAKYFKFDDTNYVHQESVTFFNKIREEDIDEEYQEITKPNNVTEANNVKSLTETEH